MTHLAVTIQDFSLSIPLRGGGAQTGSLTHLKHRGHNTIRRVRVTECREDRGRLRCLEAAITDWHLAASPVPSPVLASTFPGTETGRLGVTGGEEGTTLAQILLYFANFPALNFNTWTAEKLMRPGRKTISFPVCVKNVLFRSHPLNCSSIYLTFIMFASEIKVVLQDLLALHVSTINFCRLK